MDPIVEFANVLFLVLLLALLVERIMEILSGIWEYVEWKTGMHRFWNRKTTRLKKKYESIGRGKILGRILNLSPLTRQVEYAARNRKQGHSRQLVVLSSEAVRKAFVAGASRIVASLLGIVLCYYSKINLIEIFEEELPNTVDKLTNWSVLFQYIISGIVIGLGSEPVHNLITNMEERRNARERKAKLEKAMEESS